MKGGRDAAGPIALRTARREIEHGRMRGVSRHGTGEEVVEQHAGIAERLHLVALPPSKPHIGSAPSYCDG